MVRTSHGRSVVDTRATVQKEASYITHVLPAHVLPGCDTVAYLWGIGKGTVVKILEKKPLPIENTGRFECSDY